MLRHHLNTTPDPGGGFTRAIVTCSNGSRAAADKRGTFGIVSMLRRFIWRDWDLAGY